MTAGLGVGCVLAAFAFTIQTQYHTKILRGQMSAITLRSTARRSERFVSVLQSHAHRIQVLQLQGNLFFGNATMLSAEISKKVKENQGEIWCLLLDFTLVVGIDSSAVETVANIPIVCGRHNVKVRLLRCTRAGECDGLASSALTHQPFLRRDVM
jgi:SulP family sulfate permease